VIGDDAVIGGIDAAHPQNVDEKGDELIGAAGKIARRCPIG
jgi:hypothetical protein